MANHTSIRLGTRSSPLARWQAEWVAARLTDLGIQIELVPIKTQGDDQSGPIATLGSEGVFTKAIQRALLDRRIDLAVHSLKDLPTEPVEGLTLAVVPERESVGDVLVCPRADSIAELSPGARVGTGSMRRRSQLLHARADLVVGDIRGNIDTRLKKLDEGHFDAIVLAEAGLARLGYHDRVRRIIPKSIMLPAVGQGALGLEARADDHHTRQMLAPLDHAETHRAVAAERTMLATLRGGCLAPVGAWGRVEADGKLHLDGVVLRADGSQRIAASASIKTEQATDLGKQVAEMLIEQGASKLISQSRETSS